MSRRTAAAWCCAAQSSASSATRPVTSAWSPAATAPASSPRRTSSTRRGCTLPSSPAHSPTEAPTRRRETYYAKGQYYALSGRSPFKRHIYPLPDGAWLGLHATVDIGGRCKFGPDIEWTEGIDYSFQPEKLAKFLDFIRSYYPGLDESRLHPDYTGVRPKLYREGEPVPDFAIHGPDRHGLDGPRRPLRHREPRSHGGAGHRRGGRGDAGRP